MRRTSTNTHNVDDPVDVDDPHNVDDPATYPSVMSRSVMDYPGLYRPNRTPAITKEVFPRNKSDRTRFLNLIAKDYHQMVKRRGSYFHHPWLLFLAWKNIIICYC